MISPESLFVEENNFSRRGEEKKAAKARQESARPPFDIVEQETVEKQLCRVEVDN